MTRVLLAVLALLTLSLPAAAAPLKVVVSFSILADMVNQVGGDLTEVTSLIGPGGDAHAYDPSPADARRLAGAQLVIRNGLDLDDWMERLTRSAGYAGPVIQAARDVTPRMVVQAGATPVADPHAWQDLGNGIRYVHTIAEALASADPAHAAAYHTKADAYAASLAALDREVRDKLATVPPSKRRIITSHDAFGYLGAAYGIELLAPVGISTGAEPSAGDVARLVQQVKAEGIKAIFLEQMLDPRLVTMIAGEAGASVSGPLYADTLSPQDGPAPTYAAMFRYNLGELIAGMQQN